MSGIMIEYNINGNDMQRRNEMGNIKILNEDNYSEAIASGVVVVDFFADWCGPCHMMAPIIDEASSVYEGRVVFAKLDIEESKPIAINNKIMSIPTLLFFKDGQLADRVTGAINKSTLFERVDALL